MKGLNWQPLQLPLASGMNQRTDARALPSTQLEDAVDVQFDEAGGLQTRRPFVAIGSSIAGGGTISTARRIAANGNEFVLWTKDSLYSWNDDANRWVFRATHLAVSADEKTVYATPGDQYDGDRAELSDIVFHAWTDTDKVYMAVSDKNTGAVLLAPTAVTGTTHTRPRLVAVSSRVLLFCHEGTDAVPGNITVRAFTPGETDPAAWSAILGATGVTVLAAAASGSYYDVTRILTTATCAFVARRLTTTSYEVATLTDAATPVVTAATKARTCDGPIAVASHPSGTHLQVIRADGTNIEGDYLLVALTDVTVDQAVGTVGSTPVSQIACAYRSTQDSSQYRCYAFWSSDEATDDSNWLSKYNYVDTGGTIGAQANFVHHLGVGSRAFDHDGRVFVWGVFAGESQFSGNSPAGFRAQLQTTYFLYRDDVSLHAKCAFQRGGGLAPSVGRLPGVALTNSQVDSGTHFATAYSWCATERREIPVGSSGLQSSFDARAPRDVTFTFDDDNARRCVRLGETLYVAGAEILQYDGIGLFEVGFHIYPWAFTSVVAGVGNIVNGTYTYKWTWRWENSKGEMERSTTATTGEMIISTGPDLIATVVAPLTITHKTTTKPIAVEGWRTAVNPTEGAPFHLITSKTPASTTNPNRYLANDPTSYFLATVNDDFADATLTTKETNDENGDVLENLAPPGAKIIAATDTRIFLGNVAGDPNRIWYSKLKQAGRVVSFHDALTFDVPTDGGQITGIAFQNGICVVFREYATYMFPGDGFDNTGRGQNYGPPQVVSSDVGCRDTDSIAVTPSGIAFQSSKGKYLLTRGWTMQPIGLNVAPTRDNVSDLDARTVLAAHVVPEQHQVRFVTSDVTFVLDYLADAWALWSVGPYIDEAVASAYHACIWQGVHHILVPAGPKAEVTTSWSGVDYGMDWETAWIKPNDLQGAAAIRRLQLLGEHRSSSYHLRFRIAYNYDDDWVDDSYALQTATSADPLQQNIRMSRRKCEAFKLRVTVYGAETKSTYATTVDVPLSTGNWGATLRARGMGPLGDGLTVKIGTLVGTTAAVEVRDNQKFTTSTGLWTEEADTIGVKVTGNDTTATVTIATIEAAIDSYSDLIEVSSHHATPSHTLNFTTIATTTKSAGPTASGAFAAATGESCKVTGLAMEAGVEPKVYNRFVRS